MTAFVVLVILTVVAGGVGLVAIYLDRRPPPRSEPPAMIAPVYRAPKATIGPGPNYEVLYGPPEGGRVRQFIRRFTVGLYPAKPSTPQLLSSVRMDGHRALTEKVVAKDFTGKRPTLLQVPQYPAAPAAEENTPRAVDVTNDITKKESQ